MPTKQFMTVKLPDGSGTTEGYKQVTAKANKKMWTSLWERQTQQWNNLLLEMDQPDRLPSHLPNQASREFSTQARKLIRRTFLLAFLGIKRATKISRTGIKLEIGNNGTVKKILFIKMKDTCLSNGSQKASPGSQ